MTIGGAISDLNNLLKADDIPIYYKPSIKKVIETIELDAIRAVELQETADWIPVVTREMTEDEKEHYNEIGRPEIAEDGKIFACKLPDDGDQVLVTAYGETLVDYFYRDEEDGCYFECIDIEDVKAWMPLPEPYVTKGAQDNEEENNNSRKGN